MKITSAPDQPIQQDLPRNCWWKKSFYHLAGPNPGTGTIGEKFLMSDPMAAVF